MLPTSRTKEVTVPKTIARVPGQSDGHYGQWIEGCLAGYGNTQLSSSFDVAGPLTEALLMANLAVRGHSLKGGQLKYEWDNDNMKVTNFDAVNQYVKRTYREGWTI